MVATFLNRPFDFPNITEGFSLCLSTGFEGLRSFNWSSRACQIWSSAQELFRQAYEGISYYAGRSTFVSAVFNSNTDIYALLSLISLAGFFYQIFEFRYRKLEFEFNSQQGLSELQKEKIALLSQQNKEHLLKISELEQEVARLKQSNTPEKLD